MQKKVETVLNGKALSLEAGWLAKQANGSVVVRQGDTMVLVTATMSDSPREGIDFFPLTVDYRERTYAAGRFPGGFLKREARPSDLETLICRLIDRPIRPMFDDGFKNETQVVCFCISHDQENPPDVTAITGASAALLISDIPFHTPLAGVRVGRNPEGQFLINPTFEQLLTSDLNLVMAGTADAIVMVEAGAVELDEATMIEALNFGHEAIKELVKMQEQLREMLGKEKLKVEAPKTNAELGTKVTEFLKPGMEKAMQVPGKQDRSDAIDQLKESMKQQFNPDEDEVVAGELKGIFKTVEKEVMRNQTLNQLRVDGRKPDEIRPITCQVGFIPRAHGSAIFTRGETQALVTTTLGTVSDEQRMDTLDFRGSKNFLLHYNFPAFCTGEVKFMAGPGRREIGHGILAERGLSAVLPDRETFPYTIRIVSDILESNGSSSMASVCGGSLSLMDAGVPMKKPVAGIAMGLIKQEDQVAILSDITGTEDHLGDMDFKVVGTDSGITALQMDIKASGLTKELMAQALEQARTGRIFILGEMAKVLAAPRPQMSKYAPRITTVTVPVDKIRDVIGPGGKVVRDIIDKTGVSIDIADTGVVTIASVDEAASDKAIGIIQNLVQDVEVGKIYMGKVKKIMDFGAFVEIFPGTDGLVHISQICERRIQRVSDEISEGDEIVVKVIDVDRNGKVKLSRKEAMRDEASAALQ